MKLYILIKINQGFKSEKETIDIENQKLKELNLFLTEKYSELQKENENLKKKKNELNNASFISETIKKGK